MLEVFNRKIHDLLKGEEGFAMALTLVMWPALLIMTGGVFIYGELAKQTIHLQNAADAASYAGATVQADTLSRAAVLNKVMAWSYVQANKLEMDYVFNDFLVRSVKEFERAQESAQLLNAASQCVHPAHRSARSLDQALISTAETRTAANGYGYFTGFEQGSSYLPSVISSNKNKFTVSVDNDVMTLSDSNFTASTTNGSFVRVREHLDDAYTTVNAINQELASLKNNLPARINSAMIQVLADWGVNSNANAVFTVSAPDTYLKNSTDEAALLALSGESNVFDRSAWWSSNTDDGIRRRYNESKALQTSFSSGHVTWTPNSQGTSCIASASSAQTHYVYGRDAYALAAGSKKCGAFPLAFSVPGFSTPSSAGNALKIKVDLNCELDLKFGPNGSITDLINIPAALFNASFPSAFSYKCNSVARACPKGLSAYTVRMPAGLVSQTDWTAVWLPDEEVN